MIFVHSQVHPKIFDETFLYGRGKDGKVDSVKVDSMKLFDKKTLDSNKILLRKKLELLTPRSRTPEPDSKNVAPRPVFRYDQELLT